MWYVRELLLKDMLLHYTKTLWTFSNWILLYFNCLTMHVFEHTSRSLFLILYFFKDACVWLHCYIIISYNSIIFIAKFFFHCKVGGKPCMLLCISIIYHIFWSFNPLRWLVMLASMFRNYKNSQQHVEKFTFNDKV